MKRHPARLCVYASLICLPALALLDPYTRQSLFGPKIADVPRCAWEHDIRRAFSSKRHELTSSQKLFAKIGIDKSAYYIDGFTRPPRREPELLPIFVDLANDEDENVRWWVAVYLAGFPDHEEAIATLEMLANDPVQHVRKEAKISLLQVAWQK